MKNWYRVEAKGNAAEILIYDEIGIFGISAKNFIADLKALGNVSQITLGINSPGGDVFDGVAIYNALKRHPAKVTGRVDGIAASIASVVLMSADKIVMPDNSMLLIHNPWGVSIGDADEMRGFAEALDKIKVAILGAYRRSGKSDEELSAILDAETWYSAEEAKAAGFADEVIGSTSIAAFFDLSKFQRAPEALRGQPAAPPADQDTRAREIAEACTKAGVPAAVWLYIDTPWSSADVAARLEHAPAIRALCKEYGAEQMADHFVMFGFHPDHVKTQLEQLHTRRPESDTAQYSSKVLSLCITAGVADMAAGFIEKKMTIEEVQNRLADAQAIRAVCVASRLPTWEKRASDYIRAGVTIEEARHDLLTVLQSLASRTPEIDNKLGPESDGVTSNPGSKTTSAADIYARRRAAPKAPAEK